MMSNREDHFTGPNPPKTKGEEIFVIISFIGTLSAYLYGQWSWTPILIPIIAVMLIGFLLRLRTYLYLKDFEDEYDQFVFDNKTTNENSGLLPDKKCITVFGIRNLFRIRPIFYVKQLSRSKGYWESYLTVSELNPFMLTGIYTYTKTGRGANHEPRGGRKGDWGIHELIINPETEKIYVRATTKNKSGKVEYTLVKSNQILRESH